MLKVGLTGGIGSGKSTVAEMFASLQVPVYIADKRAKSLQNEEPLRSEIIKAFGDHLYNNGVLDRTTLAKIVFTDKRKLEKLNRLVHPAVAEDYKNWLQKQKAPYIIKEAAIIFEIGAQAQYDQIILVTAPENIRVQRIKARDRASEEDIKARISNQLSDVHKKSKADFVIENLALEKTKLQVAKIHETILSKLK